MHRLKRLFGYDDRDKGPITEQPNDAKPLATADTHLGVESTQETTKTAPAQESARSSFEDFSERTEQYLRKRIHVVEGDCLSCKIIGITFPFVGALYVFTLGSIRRRTTNLPPSQFILRYTSLGTLLLFLSYSRATDSGIFTPRVTEEEKTQGLADRAVYLFKKDFESVQKMFKKDSQVEKSEKDE